MNFVNKLRAWAGEKNTKDITHQDVDQATAAFLKKGGKIKKVKNFIDGPDYQQRLEDAEIRFNRFRYSYQRGLNDK